LAAQGRLIEGQSKPAQEKRRKSESNEEAVIGRRRVEGPERRVVHDRFMGMNERVPKAPDV
jgi:hypothetical protein